MTQRQITVAISDTLFYRFQSAAEATQQPLEAVLAHALEIGSPPNWEDVPIEFQADIAALDRLHDEALWHVARSQQSPADAERVQQLLDQREEAGLSVSEQQELDALLLAGDRLMIRKAHAVAVLRWRGHVIPPPETLSLG